MVSSHLRQTEDRRQANSRRATAAAALSGDMPISMQMATATAALGIAGTLLMGAAALAGVRHS